MDTNLLFSVIDFLKEQPVNVIQLTFSQKLKENGKFSGYKSYTPNIDEDLKKEILQLSLNDIEQYRSKNLVRYNPIGCIDETYEVVVLKDSEKEKLELYTESLSIADHVDTTIDPSELTFYALSLEVNIDNQKRSIILFRRLSKFKRLQSKGLMAYFSGKELNKLDAKVFGIDGTVDMIKIDDQLFIFNHVSIERIFDMADIYHDMTVKALGVLKNLKRIENFEIFEEDCKNDMRVKRALTKMMNESNDLKNAFDNFDNIKKTISMFELEINVIEGEKPMLRYDDKSQLLDFLRIIRDSYYVSLIKERSGIDDGI